MNFRNAILPLFNARNILLGFIGGWTIFDYITALYWMHFGCCRLLVEIW